MNKKQYVKPEYVQLQDRPGYDEKWVQDLIAKDPSILRLGDLVLLDKERRQPRAGRLDFLLMDPDSRKRYEVELQLGRADASHIIRTIEYWDIEKKRYPNYDHCAVLIAEDITSRFLNVISLFNGTMPIIAIQMQALMVNGCLTLSFLKVLDERLWSFADEDEGGLVETDETYWKQRATEETVGLAQKMLEMIHGFDESLNLKFNKHYIGLEKDGRPFNFFRFVPRKSKLNLRIYLPQTEHYEKLINDVDLDSTGHAWGAYRIHLTSKDIKSKSKLKVLEELSKAAYEEYKK